MCAGLQNLVEPGKIVNNKIRTPRTTIPTHTRSILQQTLRTAVCDPSVFAMRTYTTEESHTAADICCTAL
eukprot:SAG11_NODE_18937_length_477_cov_43.880952_1_plen_69_part_01